MSRPNRKSLKLECSASAAPIGRMATTRNGNQTKISSSASNVMRSTSKHRAVKEGTTKDERYLGGENSRSTEEEYALQEQIEATMRQGSAQDESERESEINKQQHKIAEEEDAYKCFDDWKDFYLQIFGNINSKSDLIIAFTHYILTKNGFRCLGLGDDKTYTENEEGSIYLPEGWNNFSKYAIRYIYNRMLHILLAVHLDHRLLINLLNTRTNVVTNLTVFPEITVRATCGGSIDKLIPNPEKLAQTLYSNVIHTFTDLKACARAPTLLSGLSNQKRNTWEELELRQSKSKNMSLDDVIEDIHGQSDENQDNEMQNVQLEDDDAETTKRHTNSMSKQKFPKRTSWADQQPQTASINNNGNNNNKNTNNNNNKKLKALKTSIDEVVPSIKDAILCYVDAMVNNWFGMYGKEIMKSGKMAIQNLAEQRQIIEKYMHLIKPVTEPKGGFVIYNSKITMDDTKERLLRENIEKDLKKLKANVANEFTKPFTEVANVSSSKPLNVAKKVENASAESTEQSKNVDKEKSKSLKNFINMQTKICDSKNKPNFKTQTKPATKLASPKVVSPKVELHNKKYKNNLVEKEIKSAYKIMDLKESCTNQSFTRREGGSEIKSKTTQQNSATKNAEKLKRKRVKSKIPTTTVPKKTKSNTSNIKPSKSSLKSTISKNQFHVKFLGLNPIKRIRFDLPTKPTTATPSYLSNKWPTTYKNLEILLKTSLPFSEQERKSGGYEQMNLPLDPYDLKEDFNEIKYEEGSSDTEIQQNGYDYEGNDNTRIKHNTSAFSLQSIEEHFASQIEAKRLELLEMVRKRDLQNSMERSEDDDIRKKFLQPKIDDEDDVGSFVPPADEWSLWQFRKNLAELREKEVFGSNNKKIQFKN